jgi:hypothetical protein
MIAVPHPDRPPPPSTDGMPVSWYLAAKGRISVVECWSHAHRCLEYENCRCCKLFTDKEHAAFSSMLQVHSNMIVDFLSMF